MLHMMFKLGQCIEKCWRRLRRFLDRAKVITDVKFNDGIEVSNLDQTAALNQSPNTTFDNDSTGVPCHFSPQLIAEPLERRGG